MRAHEQTLAAAGARLVYVSTGTPAHAEAFRAEHGLRGAVLSDGAGAAFAAAALRRGWGALLRPRAVTNGLRALRAGFRQRAVQGDPLQQGGAVVFGPDGAVRARQSDAGAGDLLDVEALLRALG